jgi:hypothetical protein
MSARDNVIESIFQPFGGDIGGKAIFRQILRDRDRRDGNNFLGDGLVQNIGTEPDDQNR